MSYARLYVTTRAVLGTVRFASLEASPLMASGVLVGLLCEMGTAMLLPGGWRMRSVPRWPCCVKSAAAGR